MLLLLIFCSFNGVFADQVSCERIGNYNFDNENWKTCYMDQATEINSVDTTIASRDASVQGLYLWWNKKIKFLTVSISEKFPNLLGLGGGGCSLTTISKANFKGLSKLRHLSLHNNQIEKIPSDVFNDLVALEKLYLYNNNLKLINGKAFARLTKLIRVYLRSNQCINEDFEGASRITLLQQTVNEKCSIDEFELDEYVKKTFWIVSSLADKKCEKSKDLSTFTNTTIEGMKAETSEVITKLIELKTQQKEECGSIAKVLEAQTKALKEQTAEIIEANKKLAQSESQVMLKMSENGKLIEDLQRKDQEVNENRQKIKALEAKVEILNNSGHCP